MARPEVSILTPPDGIMSLTPNADIVVTGHHSPMNLDFFRVVLLKDDGTVFLANTTNFANAADGKDWTVTFTAANLTSNGTAPNPNTSYSISATARINSVGTAGAGRGIKTGSGFGSVVPEATTAAAAPAKPAKPKPAPRPKPKRKK